MIRSHTGMVGLLALFGDTVFFLIMGSYGADGMLCLASAFYLFLLGEALAFYSTVEVVVVVAVCAVFCAALPHGALVLERTVVVAISTPLRDFCIPRDQSVQLDLPPLGPPSDFARSPLAPRS